MRGTALRRPRAVGLCSTMPGWPAALCNVQVDRLAAELLAAHGCIDILVNVAGACELGCCWAYEACWVVLSRLCRGCTPVAWGQADRAECSRMCQLFLYLCSHPADLVLVCVRPQTNWPATPARRPQPRSHGPAGG